MYNEIMMKYLDNRKELNEGKQKDDYEKIVKVIRSCKTIEQLQTAGKMVEKFSKKYGLGILRNILKAIDFIGSIDPLVPISSFRTEVKNKWVKKMLEVMKDQRKRIEMK